MVTWHCVFKQRISSHDNSQVWSSAQHSLVLHQMCRTDTRFSVSSKVMIQLISHFTEDIEIIYDYINSYANVNGLISITQYTHELDY